MSLFPPSMLGNLLDILTRLRRSSDLFPSSLIFLSFFPLLNFPRKKKKERKIFITLYSNGFHYYGYIRKIPSLLICRHLNANNILNERTWWLWQNRANTFFPFF